ncbi:hypothetical protein KUC_0423 [Vreelandella boliviensis LC1]|uniref:Uncharacterized protein n=1 Tax=Vreelandella boliviensis LC1 TaxID=1072583 RepID=A0A7U9C5E3_9GAMM|nr:hypothetical protein KUC_0423 [Halomonas boliviensis LC1]
MILKISTLWKQYFQPLCEFNLILYWGAASDEIFGFAT